jgi:pimeloyl-ACP methyl ester carboxylesterase
MLSNTAARIGTTEMWSERIAALEQGGIPLRADGVLLHWFSARWRAEHPDELAGWRRMLSRCDLQGYIGGCEALARTDLTAVCDALRRPVLAIAGSEDGATPPTIARATAARIAESEFACIEGARACPD